MELLQRWIKWWHEYNYIPKKNVINSESFRYKINATGRTCNVDAKITNAEGNEINNPAYDANKSGKKRSWNCRSIKIPE